jgi:hypothetical protein
MITAGGSRAVMFKVDTVGEEAFLRKGVAALQGFPA